MPCDDAKKKNLLRTICGAVLIALALLGYHLYERFSHDKSEEEHKVGDYDILVLSQLLFKDKLQQHPYLAKVNFQGKTRASNRDDQAQNPLLEVHDELLSNYATSTVYLMKRLFDNYELDTYTVEKITQQEKQEELDFLNAVLKTPIMQHTMQFLQKKGFPTDTHKDQLTLLQDIWFLQYSRGGGRVGSSGFEHVFLAEIKEQSILGLHNWIYFSEQERQGNLDYKGYMKQLEYGQGGNYVAAVRSVFHSIPKPYNTIFIGTSPELEMSLYTVCFLLSANQPCPVQLGTAKININTHVWDWHGKKTLATAFPSLD